MIWIVIALVSVILVIVGLVVAFLLFVPPDPEAAVRLSTAPHKARRSLEVRLFLGDVERRAARTVEEAAAEMAADEAGYQQSPGGPDA